MIKDEIQKAPDKELNLHNADYEKIVLFFQGKLQRTKLSPALDDKIEIMRQTAAWAKEYGSRNKVIPMMENAWGLSVSQAYKLYNETIRLFSTVNSQVDQRDFWVDVWLGETMDAIKRARKKGDYKSLASLLRQLKEGIKDFFGEKEVVDYEKLKPNPVILGFFPDLLDTDVPDDPEQLEALLARFKKKKKERVIDITIEDEQ